MPHSRPPTLVDMLRQLSYVAPLIVGLYVGMRFLDEKAPIAYVDKRVEESNRQNQEALTALTRQTSEAVSAAIKHGDERAADVLKEAFSYSDRNRQTMETARAVDSANVREAIAKMQSMLEQVSVSLRSMREDGFNSRPERPRR